MRDFTEERRYMETPDGAVRLLFLYPAGSAEDIQYCQQLGERMNGLADRLRSEIPGAEAITAGFTGIHAMTGESATFLAEDMKIITAGALVGIVAALWFAFRKRPSTM